MIQTTRSRHTWRAAALSGIAVSALILTACTGAAPSTPLSTDAPTTIDFWHASSGPAGEVLEKLTKDFNAKNDLGISVNLVFQGSYSDLLAKFTNGVTSGDIPELMQASDITSGFMLDSGVTVSAQQSMEKFGVDYNLEGMVPAVKSYYSVNGDLASIPVMTSQPLLYINPDLAAAAGLDPESPPRTFDEVFDWAEAIHAATGTAGLTFHMSPWWNEEFSAAAGVEYCTPENGTGAKAVTEMTYTDPAQVALWTRLQELFASGAVLNVGTDGNASMSAFTTGTAAMLFGSSGTLGTISAALGDDFVPVAFPLSDPDGGAVPGGNSVWIIGQDKTDKQQAAAAEFAAFLGSASSQEQIFAASGYLPSQVAAQKSLAGGSSAAEKVLLHQLVATPSTTATAGCHTGALTETRTAVQTAMEQIANGADVISAFKTAETASEEILATYNERASK